MKRLRLLPFLLIFCLSFAIASPAALALEAPSVTASSIVLADLDSGNILYEKNMNIRRPPASLTKIMTGLLAVEAVERGEVQLDDLITAPADCWEGLDLDSSNAEISPGEQMTFKDFLCCALIKSANEACNVIAVALAGNIQSFVNRMNMRALELGCTGTYFSDTNGLSSENHYTTAYDLYLISREAMKHNLFAEIVDSVDYSIPATNTHAARVLNNSNALICQDGTYGDDYLYQGASGVKTGYTRAAGYCLVSTAERKGVHLLCVILGCHGLLNTGEEDYGNFSGTIRLYDWAFHNFAYRDFFSYGQQVTQVPVDYAKDNIPATLLAVDSVSLLLPKDLAEDDVKITITANYDDLVAPIAAGTVLGKATVYVNGEACAVARLATAVDIEMERSAYIKACLQLAFAEPWVKVAAIIIFSILFLYFLIMLRYRAVRKRHLRQRREAEDRRRRQHALEVNYENSRKATEEMMHYRDAHGDSFPDTSDKRITSIDPSHRDLNVSDISSYFKR